MNKKKRCDLSITVFGSGYPNTEIVVDLQEIEKINVDDVNNCCNISTKNNINETSEIAKHKQKLMGVLYELYNK